MATILQESINVKVVSFVMLVTLIWIVKVDALVYRHANLKLDENPITRSRFSINNRTKNGSIVSKEVINHVHHKHEQTVGNVHILTHINIANLITILNTSAPTITDRPSSDATINSAKVNNWEQRGIISNDKHEQFGRPERNREVDNRPIKFPENSRGFKWPSETERHATHFDVESKTDYSLSSVIFPTSNSKSENDLTMTENANKQPIVPIDWQPDETNENRIDPSIENSINITTIVANQTDIESGLEPLLYIGDDGTFQVKYVPKGENVSIPNNGNDDNNEQQHSNEPSFASINKSEETAINSNDNQQISQNHHTSIQPNTEHSTTPATIDLIHGADASVGANADVINNVEMIFQWNVTHSKDPTSSPTPLPLSSPSSSPQEHQQLPSDNEPPRLFNGRPIFV